MPASGRARAIPMAFRPYRDRRRAGAARGTGDGRADRVMMLVSGWVYARWGGVVFLIKAAMGGAALPLAFRLRMARRA